LRADVFHGFGQSPCRAPAPLAAAWQAKRSVRRLRDGEASIHPFLAAALAADARGRASLQSRG
jgi:hypothetical protein